MIHPKLREKCCNPTYAMLTLILSLGAGSALAQSAPATASVPTFTGSFTTAGKQYHYTIAGGIPAAGGTTTIPTVLVPISLVFDAPAGATGTKPELTAASVVSKVVQSPIFQKFTFATGRTQYGDAVQRAQFYSQAAETTGPKAWHTLLGQPRITPELRIEVPVADGYVLTSRRSGLSLAVVDVEFVKQRLFESLPKLNVRPNQLAIALTKNTEFYPLDDATVCCSWGAHGARLDASSKSAQAYILGTYLDPGAVPHYADVQTLSEQLVEWLNDPLHGYRTNVFPAWMKPLAHSGFGCGGRGEGTFYRFAEPTDGASLSNATPVNVHGAVYHLENVALLPWFAENSQPGTFESAYSFPDTHVLTQAARPCPDFRRFARRVSSPTAQPLAETRAPNGHELIGYWTGYTRTFPLRDVSPQWDVVIVAFAPPAKGSTSVMYFRTPVGQTEGQFKSEIEYLQHKGKKALISLGGGGQVVILKTPEDLRDFVTSVSAIVAEYGFDGVDLDLETPSLILDPGDTDFRKPTTPAVVNLISAMRQLRQHFGPKFMIAEVPEGPQVPAGMVAYGGQFGSFLPVIYGTRDILSFVDVQNYNTPPLEGLDGNYYQPGNADYYVAMAELMVRGFPVGRNPKSFFPPLPPEKVAIGFLAGPRDIPTIENTFRYLIEGKPFPGGRYKLRQSSGYPNFNGAMFWNIQSDRRDNYQLSNAIGPLLHRLPTK